MQYVRLMTEHPLYIITGTQALYAYAMFDDAATKIEGVALYFKAFPKDFEEEMMERFTLEDWHMIINDSIIRDEKQLINW